MSGFEVIKGGGLWNTNVARGDNISTTWNVYDEAGVAYVWSGATISATIVNGTGGVNWSTNVTVNGILTVSLTAGQTGAFPSGSWGQFIRVTKSGATCVWLAGTLTFRSPQEPAPVSLGSATLRLNTSSMGTIVLRAV